MLFAIAFLELVIRGAGILPADFVLAQAHPVAGRRMPALRWQFPAGLFVWKSHLSV